MKKYVIFLCLIVFVCQNVWGQYSDVSIERANSLSSMADFYRTAHNYEKAVELETQSLKVREKLFGSNSIEYVVSVSSLADCFYLSGDFTRASDYLSLSLKSIRELINKNNIDQDLYRQLLYGYATNLLDKLVNCISRNPTDSAVSILYDESINIRTLRLRKGEGKWYTWKDVSSHLKKKRDCY